MVEVNLLSDEQAPREVFLSNILSRNISFVVGIVLVLLALSVSVSIFIYRSSLESEIRKINQDIARIGESVDANLLTQMKVFDNQIINLKKVLDAHREGSKLFSFLEEHTLRQVMFNDLSVNVDRPEFNVSGRAVTYTILAKQISHLESIPGVTDVSISDISLTSEGGVKFSMRVRLKPELFMEE